MKIDSELWEHAKEFLVENPNHVMGVEPDGTPYFIMHPDAVAELIKESQYIHGAGGLLSDAGEEAEVESKPYSGADDPAIPDNVPDDKRGRWVEIFNQVLEDTQDESRAFAVANAYLKKNAKAWQIYTLIDMHKDYGFKLLDDDTFIGWYSNSYKDREGEILARAGFEADIELMEASNAYPDLCFWHIRGAVWGKATAVALIGRFVVAVGEVYDTELAKALKIAVQSTKNMTWGMSHGFVYNPSQFLDQTYNEFHTFEISVLPVEEAANTLTGFGIGGTDMPQINPKAIDALEKALAGTSIDVNDIILAGLEQTAKADQSFDFKGFERTFKEAMGVEYDGAVMEVETGVDMVSIVERLGGLENMVGEILTRLAPVEEAAMDDATEEEPPAKEPEKVEEVVEVRSLKEDIKNLTEAVKGLVANQASQAQSVQHQQFAHILGDYRNNGLPAEKSQELPLESTLSVFKNGLFAAHNQNGGNS